jgi:hypothetical protein
MIFINFDKIANSRPQIEGLCVNFLRNSDFRGHFWQFRGEKFAILSQKPPSRDSNLSASNQSIFIKIGYKTTEKIFKKMAEI